MAEGSTTQPVRISIAPLVSICGAGGLRCATAPAATTVSKVLAYARTGTRRHRQTRLRITYAAITAPSSRVSNGTKRASGIPVAMAAAREEDLASGCAIGSATPPSGQSAPCAWGELYAQGFPPPACVLPCCCDAATISSAMACGASTLSISSRLDSPEVSIEMSPTPSMRWPSDWSTRTS